MKIEDILAIRDSLQAEHDNCEEQYGVVSFAISTPNPCSAMESVNEEIEPTFESMARLRTRMSEISGLLADIERVIRFTPFTGAFRQN